MDTPDLRLTKNNKHFTTFRIKVAREESNYQDYINCVCWDDALAQQFAQGIMINDEISLTGSMYSNRYTNNKGVTCYTYEVVVKQYQLLHRAPNTTNQSQNNGYFNAQPAAQTQPAAQNAQPATVNSPLAAAAAKVKHFSQTSSANQPQAPSTGSDINDPLAGIAPAAIDDNDLPF